MADLFYVGVTIFYFAVSVALVYGFQRMLEG